MQKPLLLPLLASEGDSPDVRRSCSFTSRFKGRAGLELIAALLTGAAVGALLRPPLWPGGGDDVSDDAGGSTAAEAERSFGSATLSPWTGGGANAAPKVLLEPPERRYSSSQFLGFNLFTAPGTAADGCFGDSGEELELCYLGRPKTDEDISQREKIMMEAINRTFMSSEWDRNPDVLKVFVAPEFFWRGSHGAYRLDPRSSALSKSLIQTMTKWLESARFENWLFILGTFVAAQHVDERWVDESQLPWANISYFNFAPIHVGGTKRSFVHFKHFISGIDFLHTQPSVPRTQPQTPPGVFSNFCHEHPYSNGCIYGKAPRAMLEDIGFGQHQVLPGGLVEIGGIRIGLEICLDHAEGELCKHLGPGETVDMQIIVSAGMNIPTGPVCTAPGGPVFLSDGFARTELNFNKLGLGTHSEQLPDGRRRRYNVGVVYGADALVGLQQWIADTLDSFTGYGFGSRLPGESTLPGGSPVTGTTGVKFAQVNALGEDWFDKVSGFYDVNDYIQAQKIDRSLNDAMKRFLHTEDLPPTDQARRASLFPTVDIYGPLAIPSRADDSR